MYDPVSRRCTVARAGHPPPVVVAPDGEVSLPDLPAGPRSGSGGLPFEAAELELAEGSLLALYTNGLIAGATRTSTSGLARLCGGAGPARTGRWRKPCQAVVDALLPARPTDDVALLIARTRTLAAGAGRHLGAAGGAGRAARARALTAASSPSGAWRTGLHHRADRQRAGHQRLPLRQRPARCG